MNKIYTTYYLLVLGILYMIKGQTTIDLSWVNYSNNNINIQVDAI